MGLTGNAVFQEVHLTSCSGQKTPGAFAGAHPRLINVHLRFVVDALLGAVLELDELALFLGGDAVSPVCEIGFGFVLLLCLQRRLLGASSTQPHTPRKYGFVSSALQSLADVDGDALRAEAKLDQCLLNGFAGNQVHDAGQLLGAGRKENRFIYVFAFRAGDLDGLCDAAMLFDIADHELPLELESLPWHRIKHQSTKITFALSFDSFLLFEFPLSQLFLLCGREGFVKSRVFVLGLEDGSSRDFACPCIGGFDCLIPSCSLLFVPKVLFEERVAEWVIWAGRGNVGEIVLDCRNFGIGFRILVGL